MTRASTVALAAIVAVVALAVATRAARAEDAPDYPTAIAAEVAAGRVGSAVVLCEDAEKAGRLGDDALKRTCAQAMVAVGDKLMAAGSPENARKRWVQAAALDPRLLDDEAFGKKLEASKAPPEPTKPREVPPPDQTHVKIEQPTTVLKKPPTPARPKRPAGPPGDAGPRWSRSLGLGLSFGFDGVMAADLGWLVDERWLIEVAIGIIYPTTDVRFRWLGLKRCVTPYLGAGILIPFGAADRLDLDIASFRSLYELGEAFHVDIGLAYTPVHRLDITAGIAFLTPFDQDHPDTVMFFPQLSAGASWYF